MGSGQFAFHFVPDVTSDWEYLRLSTGQISVYNIFGHPVIGADICGFIGNEQVKPELCARWYQLGSFYTFARNQHQPTNDIPNNQEPYQFNGIYFEAIAASIHLRYSILKQMNAFFFNKPGTAERKYGTITRPLFFEFPHESTLPPYGHRVHEEQFMLTEMLMIAPVVYEGQTNVEAYFPDWRWFDMRDLTEVPARGQMHTISAGLNELPPYFLRGGYILMKQETQNIRSSEDLDNNFAAYVALSDINENPLYAAGGAEGYIMGATNYTEEYIYENCVKRNCLLKIRIEYSLSKHDRTNIIIIRSVDDETTSTSATDGVTLKAINIMGIAPNTEKMHIKEIICPACSDAEKIFPKVNINHNVLRLYSMDFVLKPNLFYMLILTDSP